MRAVVFGYFGTLTDPGAEEYRERAGPGRARYRVDPDDALCEYTVDDPAGLQIHMLNGRSR
ncbi:hypothetical protein [Actinoplanes xinjiangensis]|uniref:hypothetical protein n=1 Tax=Actinoplanes xinjiangensis TaxID=512350 RepID=UPI003416148F